MHKHKNDIAEVCRKCCIPMVFGVDVTSLVWNKMQKKTVNEENDEKKKKDDRSTLSSIEYGTITQMIVIYLCSFPNTIVQGSASCGYLIA